VPNQLAVIRSAAVVDGKVDPGLHDAGRAGVAVDSDPGRRCVAAGSAGLGGRDGEGAFDGGVRASRALETRAGPVLAVRHVRDRRVGDQVRCSGALRRKTRARHPAAGLAAHDAGAAESGAGEQQGDKGRSKDHRAGA
ncbi:unnamed protein product, partial [Mycena citricolor]